MASLKMDSSAFAIPWLSRMFLGAVPFSVALRIFDVYMHQGHKVHYKIGLALLHNSKDRLLKTRSSFAFLSCLTDCIKSLEDPARVFKRAWRFKISYYIKSASKSKAAQSRTSQPPPTHKTPVPAPSSTSTEPIAPKLKEFYPTISFKSRLMTNESWNYIYNWMPIRFTIRDPTLLHSMDQEGSSLPLIYKTLAKHEPSLVVIKTKQERVRLARGLVGFLPHLGAKKNEFRPYV